MKPIEILSEAIEREGVTGTANALGVGPSAVSQWANGQGTIPPAAALLLAERHGLPEPNHYEVIAAATKQPKLRDWAEKKARGAAGVMVFVVAVFAGLLVSPTVEAHGISTANNIASHYILCAIMYWCWQ
jgi:hypothetical protein